MENRVWRLRSRPNGALKDSDLELCREAVPKADGANVVVKTLYISIDPTHRIWMSDKAQARCGEPLLGSNCRGVCGDA